MPPGRVPDPGRVRRALRGGRPERRGARLRGRDHLAAQAAPLQGQADPGPAAALDRELAAVAATPAVGRLPAPCRDCGALIERLAGCVAVPGATRSALQLAYRDSPRRGCAATTTPGPWRYNAALERIMGLLLAAVAVEFIAAGARELLRAP